MKKRQPLLLTIFALVAMTSSSGSVVFAAEECIILLHGLARTKKSMKTMEQSLRNHGYTVINDGYESRKYTVEVLAEKYIPLALQKCQYANPDKIHFVTHSLGGILVRYYLSQHTIPKLGRVVMLSPPNKGSETVDKLAKMPGWKMINGKAGEQLGTNDLSVPLNLGPATFEVGIITGDKSINLILSTMIPGKDDGKVGIERAKLEGMTDFLVVPHSHPFIMSREKVIEQTIHFIEHGYFKHKSQTVVEEAKPQAQEGTKK